MSTRRSVGEWVYIRPGAGFLPPKDGRPFRAEIIQSDGYDDPDGYDTCCFLCDDPECREWATLWTEPDASGRRAMLCHVNECQMFDDGDAA